MGGGTPGSTAPPAYTGEHPMPTSFNIAGTFRHAIDLVRGPAALMNAYRDADSPINAVMIYYVAVLAAVAFVATLIGYSWYYGLFGYFGLASGAIIGFAVTAGVLQLIFGIIAVFVAGFVIWKLGPNFKTETTQIRATRLAAYAFTPYFLLSILNIIPIIGFLSILGVLYGLYILYLGLPIMLGTPKEQQLTYVIVSVIVMVVVYGVLAAIAGAVTGAIFIHSLGFFP
jgi:hypothetical protein